MADVRTEVEHLSHREPVTDSPVLSIYLDVDQSKAVNLHRKFQTAIGDMLRSIEARLQGAQLENFAADAAIAREHINHFEPSGKGLILFADASEEFFWSHEVQVPLRNNARWDDTPYVKPLLVLIDEYERNGIVLIDKERGRLLTVFMGEISEYGDFLAPLPVRRIKSPGLDQMLSERRLQNRAAIHTHLHIKNVAEALDRLVDQYAFDRIFIGGPVEAASELREFVSKRVRRRILDRISLPVRASLSEILAETIQIEGRLERQFEERIVGDLIAGDDGHHPFILGLEPTLLALAEERIWRMIYADDFNPSGGQCAHCGMLFASSDGSCKYCGEAINPTEDLMERMVIRALDQDSLLKQVSGNAGTRLRQAGGVGAILRF